MLNMRWIVGAALLGGCATAQHDAAQQRYADAQAQVAAAVRAQNAQQFQHSDAERDRFIDQWTEGYAAVGEPVSGDLGQFQTIPVQLERGTCYMMVLRLQSDAQFSEHAQGGIVFLYTRTDGKPEINGGPGIHGAGGVGSGGCPLESGPAEFDMQANLGRATDTSRVHELGAGGYTLQLFTKTITDADLARLEADRAQQIEESERFKADQERKEAERRSSGCSKCQAKYTECLADFRRGATKAQCEQEQRSCLFSEARVTNPADCH